MNRKKLIVLIAAVTVVTAPSTVTVWADNTTTSETANGYIESELDNNTPLYEPDESLYMSVPTAYPENGIADIRADYPAIVIKIHMVRAGHFHQQDLLSLI